MKHRKAQVSRKTKETEIQLYFNIDGSGESDIKTGIPFFDHMLDLFTTHAVFDLNLTVNGDIEVDFHHTVEDTGICLGQAFRKALGDAKQIKRFASGLVPMDESLCKIAVDISGRSYLDWKVEFPNASTGNFDTELAETFFHAFADHARITLHMDVNKGRNVHHILEACFKGLGICLDEAAAIDDRKKGVPSTKGTLI
ncbi:MAG: imidazoleglycerol-phosphate dehydratase HisB [bacterium]|nr:imidazoleglycerol-phosphate dehydratase HisB [bacterium]